MTDAAPPIAIEFLTDGGQPAEQTAQRLIPFLDAAQRTLDLAVYDAVTRS